MSNNNLKAELERIDVKDLILDPTNARKHSQKNLEAIKGSLTRFGQQKPIVVSKDNIVLAGNGTLVAARSLGWTHVLAIRSRLTGAESIAYGIADNRTAELASWDTEILTEHLNSLKIESFDLKMDLGFDLKDLQKLGLEDAPMKTGVSDTKEYLIICECVDEEEQQDLFDKLREMKIKCRIMS